MSRSIAASAPSSNNPPYLVSVNATLLCPAHSETSRTLQPAATMIATTLCRSAWKVMPSNPARSAAGRKTLRPHERKSGPPEGAVNTRASEVGSTNSDRCSSSRRVTERAMGTERFERVVLGSLSKVTRPRNSTAVEVMQMRERNGSMSRLRKPAASPHRSPAHTNQHEGTVLRRHLTDEALHLALRQIARALLARGRKGHCARGIELNPLVGNRSS
jgi:hypothetical protein